MRKRFALALVAVAFGSMFQGQPAPADGDSGDVFADFGGSTVTLQEGALIATGSMNARGNCVPDTPFRVGATVPRGNATSPAIKVATDANCDFYVSDISEAQDDGAPSDGAIHEK